MDIYSYLKKDHRKVSDLMTQLLSTRNPLRREEIFDDIKQEFLVHAEAEEATFYAALANQKETGEKIEESQEEHEEILDYLDKLTRMSVESEKWIELFGELKHAVEHHVRNEEERIFVKAKRLLSDEEAERLAYQMERKKQATLEEAAPVRPARRVHRG